MRAVGSGNLKSLAREEKEAEEEFNVIGPQDIDCGLAQAEDWLETSLSCSPAAEGRCDDDCEVFEAGGGWEGVVVIIDHIWCVEAGRQLSHGGGVSW